MRCNQLFCRLGLVIVFLATVSPAVRAGLVTTVGKRVNPGSTSGVYSGFASNAFTSETALNSGPLASIWVSYALGLTPSAGTKISAYDITINSPLDAGHGLHQRYTFNEDTGLYDPTPSSSNIGNGDSHLVVSGTTQAVPPTENKFDLGGPQTAPDTSNNDYGVGTSLQGVWGFRDFDQALQTDGTPVWFAYIVVPRGSETSLTIVVKAATTNPNGFPGPDFIFGSSNFFPVPEPATLSLLGLALVGGLGFLRRRRPARPARLA